jgi:type I restriction enzyme S subunit
MNTLGEVFKISKGKKAIESSVETTLRYIQIGDLRNDDIMKYTTESSTNVLCTKDDILIAWDGANAGTVGYNLEGVIGSTLAKLSPKKEGLHINYVGRFLQSKFEYLRENCTGATIPHLSRPILENLQIPLPPLEQQKKIAAILDAADTYRQLTKALIAKYDELTQSLFLDMFGDPVKNEKGWELNKLKEISTKIHSGNTPKGGSEVYVDNGIVFFRSQNVWKKRLIYEDIAFIDQNTHNKMIKSSLKYKDILMTKTGRINTENSSLGRAAIYLGEDDNANVNGHVYLIRLKKDIIHEFVLHILTTKEYRGHIRSVCVGGIDKRQLNKEHIEDFPIIQPPIPLQTQFAERVQAIETQKAQAQASLVKAEELFNSLLQRAFNGEL